MAERADQLDLSARRPASTGVDLPFCGYIEDEPSWKKTPIKVCGRHVVYIQFCKFGRYLQRYKAEIPEDAATTSTYLGMHSTIQWAVCWHLLRCLTTCCRRWCSRWTSRSTPGDWLTLLEMPTWPRGMQGEGKPSRFLLWATDLQKSRRIWLNPGYQHEFWSFLVSGIYSPFTWLVTLIGTWFM